MPEASLNIQLMDACISLTLNCILEDRSIGVAEDSISIQWMSLGVSLICN